MTGATPLPLSSESDPQPVIQAALDAAAAAGGGMVTIPPGIWECGTIHLRSGLHLHLVEGAVLRMSRDPARFPVIVPQIPKPPGRIQAMLWGESCADLVLSGPGTIDGGRPEPLAYRDSLAIDFRPALVLLRDCRRVVIRDCLLRNSDFWTLHLLRCEDVEVRGVTIRNNRLRINTDGIDPDGCRRVTIADCDIEAGDDAIVLKSTEGDPCEDVEVRHCRLSSACAALKLGTESLGPIRRVRFADCVIRDTARALCLYMKDGGLYEDIVFAGIDAEATHDFPVIVDATPRWFGDGRPTGSIRRIRFEDVRIAGPGRIYLEGAEDAPLQDIVLRRVTCLVPAPQDFRGVIKSRGAGEGRADPHAVNHAERPFHVIAARVHGLDIDNLELHVPGDCGRLYAWRVSGLRLADRLASGGMYPGACHVKASEPPSSLGFSRGSDA
jgi:hypothetical protein